MSAGSGWPKGGGAPRKHPAFGSSVLLREDTRWGVQWGSAIYSHPPNIKHIPIGSMYGIYAHIGGILMVNVTIYTIHGSYGILNIY